MFPIRIIDLLTDFGLTEREAEVYILISKSPNALKAKDISKNLKIIKSETYRILKNLQSKCWIEPTLEHPMRFTAVPFRKVLDLYIEDKREELAFLEHKK